MRFPTLSTYSSTYLLFLDKLVQRSVKALFCVLGAAVTVENHADPLIRNAELVRKFTVRYSVVVHSANKIASPLRGHLLNPPFFFVWS